MTEEDASKNSIVSMGYEDSSIGDDVEINDISLGKTTDDARKILDKYQFNQYEQLSEKAKKEILDELKSYVRAEKENLEREEEKTKSRLDNQIKQTDVNFEKIRKDLERKIENSKLSVIETLGIFIALFTFVSVDFQVFKSYRNPVAIGSLTAILVGSIFVFVIFLDYFILQARRINRDGSKEKIEESKEDKRLSRNRTILFGVSLGMIILGLTAFCFSPIEKFEDDKNQIKNEILDLVKTDIENKNINLENTNAINSEAIKSVNTSVSDMKNCVKNFGFTYKCFENN